MNDTQNPTDRVGQEIRGTHPYAFRSGRWARVITVIEARGRDCWLIEFADEVTDLWPCDDGAAGYEFRAPNQ